LNIQELIWNKKKTQGLKLKKRELTGTNMIFRPLLYDE
jgi:hypothetical protein